MKDNEYFEQTEDMDWILLNKFNDKHHFFAELKHIEGLKHYDASGRTTDGRTARIELKSRNMNLGDYETLYIENHKTANLLLDYIALNDEPIYMNFLQDGHTVIFNLRKLKKRPEIDMKRTKSRGYNGYEYNTRNGLWLSDAIIYDKDGKRVQ